MTRNRAARLAEAEAFRLVLLLGVVDLFADMTYEGARSINGPFLGSLGASAVAIGVVAETGEFLGYSLRAGAAMSPPARGATGRSCSWGTWHRDRRPVWGSLVPAVVVFSMGVQLASLPLFFLSHLASDR